MGDPVDPVINNENTSNAEKPVSIPVSTDTQDITGVECKHDSDTAASPNSLITSTLEGQPPNIPVEENLVNPIRPEKLEDQTLEAVKTNINKFRDPENWLKFPGVKDDELNFTGSGILTQNQCSKLNHGWIIGDVHADLVGLACIFQYIQEQSELRESQSLVVLLGDLIDDLKENTETLSLVSEFIENYKGCTILLKGNHDEALILNEGGFKSNVSPSDYSDHLQDRQPDSKEYKIANSFTQYIKDAPAAIFLRDGTLLAHGGVPHIDLHPDIIKNMNFDSPEAINDFIWARLIPKVKKRFAVPHAITRSRELGSTDFEAFLKIAHQVLGFKVNRMVRGHDHVDPRCEIYGGIWKQSVVTINNMSWRLPREFGLSGPTDPHIIEWNQGLPLQPLKIEIDPEWRKSMHVSPSESKS